MLDKAVVLVCQKWSLQTALEDLFYKPKPKQKNAFWVVAFGLLGCRRKQKHKPQDKQEAPEWPCQKQLISEGVLSFSAVRPDERELELYSFPGPFPEVGG